MQRCSHSFSTASVLRSVFFPPNSQTCVSTFLAPSYAPDFPQAQHPLYYQSRSRSQWSDSDSRAFSRASTSRTFSTRATYPGSEPPSSRASSAPRSKRFASPELRKFGLQSERRPKDEEIQSRNILLVETDVKGSRAVPLKNALACINRQQQFIVQVGLEQVETMDAPEEGWDGDLENKEPQYVRQPRPVCKVIDRKTYFETEQKAKKTQQGVVKRPKELEFSWTIDPNDMRHRLTRAADFLADGKKVEIHFVTRKRAKPVAMEDAEALVKQVRERMLENLKVKESRPMEGQMGETLVLSFEMRQPQKQQQQQQPEEEQEQQPEQLPEQKQ